MNIIEISRYAKIKGLNLVGTGDLTHPQWLKELNQNLVEIPGINLYKPVAKPESQTRFMITGEVSTIFLFEGKVRKIHHIIFTPDFETVVQINERLANYGDLMVDGRPILDMTGSQLVEEVIGVSRENVVIPAHVWTPWFGIFGAFSGFDELRDCYQDMSGHIFALETGLSSDPPMNWRLSSLDRFTLISNSDSHSPWPWRLGREANVFELKRLTYRTIIDSIRKRDSKRFRFTIETNPAYGKYHWTGHRKCDVSISSKEAIKLGNRCPVCHRMLTRGVEQRVEELANRPDGFRPENKIGYIHLLPLSEIISTVMGVTYQGAKGVWDVYNMLVSRFGDEYTVLMDASKEEMSEIVDPKIADSIVRVREGRVKIMPGYDGVYGRLILCSETESENSLKRFL